MGALISMFHIKRLSLYTAKKNVCPLDSKASAFDRYTVLPLRNALKCTLKRCDTLPVSGRVPGAAPNAS